MHETYDGGRELQHRIVCGILYAVEVLCDSLEKELCLEAMEAMGLLWIFGRHVRMAFEIRPHGIATSNDLERQHCRAMGEKLRVRVLAIERDGDLCLTQKRKDGACCEGRMHGFRVELTGERRIVVCGDVTLIAQKDERWIRRPCVHALCFALRDEISRCAHAVWMSLFVNLFCFVLLLLL